MFTMNQCTIQILDVPIAEEACMALKEVLQNSKTKVTSNPKYHRRLVYGVPAYAFNGVVTRPIREFHPTVMHCIELAKGWFPGVHWNSAIVSNVIGAICSSDGELKRATETEEAPWLYFFFGDWEISVYEKTTEWTGNSNKLMFRRNVPCCVWMSPQARTHSESLDGWGRDSEICVTNLRKCRVFSLRKN
jgi:hypothetical protein